MVFSVQQIKYEFLAYMKEFGGEFGDWYVGLASEPEKALFDARRVNRETGLWIYKPALTVKATTTVLQYFKENLHADGDPVGAATDAMTFVYLFRKTQDTSPAS